MNLPWEPCWPNPWSLFSRFVAYFANIITGMEESKCDLEREEIILLIIEIVWTLVQVQLWKLTLCMCISTLRSCMLYLCLVIQTTCLHVFYNLFFCSFTFVLRDKVSLYSRDWSWTHHPSAPAFQNLWFHVCITTSNCTLIVFSCVSTLKYRPVSEHY